MDVGQFLTNEKLAASVVGFKLDDLVWPKEVNELRNKEPDITKLCIAPEIPAGGLEWNGKSWD